ncbi:MAG: TlpA family protein disulfide reductase [Oscillochloridaceae bacterium umkhey_bin13]
MQTSPTPPRRMWLALIGLVAVFGLVLIGLGREQPTPVAAPTAPAAPPPEATPAPRVGNLAPGFRLENTSGEFVDLADLRGQVVLVNLWASWCPPCRAEMPAIQAAYDRYGPEGFVVLAVNQGEPGPVAAGFMAEHQLNFMALLDPYGQVGFAYQVNALPASFFIDRNGLVRSIYKGPISHRVIAGTVEALLAEP